MQKKIHYCDFCKSLIQNEFGISIMLKVLDGEDPHNGSFIFRMQQIDACVPCLVKFADISLAPDESPVGINTVRIVVSD